MRRVLADVCVSLVVGCSALFGQAEPERSYTVSGVGAYPISAALTSMWLAAPGGRPLIMVFFHGPAGWHEGEWKTSSKFQKGLPGWAEFTSSKARTRIWLDADTGKAEVQSEKVSTAEANTYLVLHMTERSDLQKIVPLGIFDLPRSKEGDPASAILLREQPKLLEKIEKAAGATGGVNIPPGMTWHEVPEIMGSFLVPKGWHFTKSSSSPYTYFITEKKYAGVGRFDTGLKISVRKLPADQQVLPLAEKLVSDGCKETEQIQPPFSESFGSTTAFSCIVRLNADGNPVTLALTEIAGPKKNTLYTLTFQSPTAQWEKAWELGKYMIGHFTLDDDF